MTDSPLTLADFDYDLPDSFIAQTPLEPRDSSRLMRVNRRTGQIDHAIFRDMVDFLYPGDVLVLNNTRVMPARLHATKAQTGGVVEVLLLRRLPLPTDGTRWHVLVGGRRVIPGVQLIFGETGITATVTELLEESERVITFNQPIDDRLDALGDIPLPPYITAPLIDPERYQTVYNRHLGSAAAPTAGLHFTPALLDRVREKGVQIAYCTLHVGLGTFLPVRIDSVADYKIHHERATLSPADADVINAAKTAGGRVIGVGTTVARTLETAGVLAEGGDPAAPHTPPAATSHPLVAGFDRDTNLYIYPGYRWRAVDALVTNFHLPKSTLLMMISSLASREIVFNAYETAKRENYRFFSFGDAMLLY